MYAWLMHLMSRIFGNTAKKNMEKENWTGPDNTESGPDVSEDSSDDDDGGNGGDEEGLYSSAQGGFG